ncbi:arginine:ornithine antiporter/lysine permease [Bradyrhizobium ottawaense]
MASSSNEANQELSRNALIALVIGSMVGSGIFALPAAFGRATGAFGAIIAWIIAGTGMLMLALVFQSLSQRKPELDAGIYAYAKAGFGDYIGFASAAGYWIGCCLADVACLILIKATLGQFFPIFGDGTTPTAIASATLLLWSVHFLVLRGIRGAARLNTIATFAKIVPILLFIVVAAFVLDRDLLVQNFWGTEPPNLQQVLSQVRSTMLLTVFVFVGVEGASVYSRYARNRADIGIATVVGFLSVLCLLVLVTLLSYGVLPRSELADLSTPSMAGVMESMVGRWGSVFISLALLISILGNYLSWSLLAAEILHSAAMHHTMPSFLARENANKVPVGALWLTNCVIQAFLLASWFAEYAFTLALKMTSAMTLILLRSRRGLWPQARIDRRDLLRRRARPHDRLDPRRRRDALRRRDDLRRRTKVSPAVLDPLRARNLAVPDGQTRAQGKHIHENRSHPVCGGRNRGGRWSLRARRRCHFDLTQRL